LKSDGDRASPCFKPFLTGNISNSYPPGLCWTFQSGTFWLALPVSRGYQTQWEYCTRPLSKLNHKLSWSPRRADALPHSVPIFSQVFDEYRICDQCSFVITQPWQRPVTTWVYKPEVPNTVWSSWWWAECRLKRVEPFKNFGIINSIAAL
jgi:hypothetical protein